ncbi:hypothetical protein LCGC14_0587400 [marine sediment metagenome]|uniref:N-acetyltransferase domain-containing protein n=1 Tax=marine sediment metagenome TaxID=412755 RepID=A0A0F9UMR7_9ZZZZ|nr:MAG: Acetyltransferase (GNAT) family protein [Candidatus Lokiarchaeum sp. GC14_75]HEC40205.1 GNAT family N-acetyltransferase [bacterium]
MKVANHIFEFFININKNVKLYGKLINLIITIYKINDVKTNMQSYTIREPEDGEIIECIKVFLQSFGRNLSNRLEEERKVWTYLIQQNIAKFIVAVKNDKIIGIGGIFLFHNVSSIGYMGVLPDYRSQGIGTAIFRKLMGLSVSMNSVSVNLFASKFGQPIYEKFGFKGNYCASAYKFPKNEPDLQNKEKIVKEIQILPDWLLEIDRKTMGYDRSKYLQAKLYLGDKILVVENEGYAFLSKILSTIRIGPLITTNLKATLCILKESKYLGAENLIIPKISKVQNDFISLMGLIEVGTANLKMEFGRELTQNLDYLYAIGTYAKG